VINEIDVAVAVDTFTKYAFQEITYILSISVTENVTTAVGLSCSQIRVLD